MNIATLLGLITTASTSVALDSAVKIITPPATKALTGFAVKAGTIVVGGIISSKIGAYVSAKTTEIQDIINDAPAEPAQEDI